MIKEKQKSYILFRGCGLVFRSPLSGILYNFKKDIPVQVTYKEDFAYIESTYKNSVKVIDSKENKVSSEISMVFEIDDGEKIKVQSLSDGKIKVGNTIVDKKNKLSPLDKIVGKKAKRIKLKKQKEN